jgi:hypothetical protein
MSAIKLRLHDSRTSGVDNFLVNAPIAARVSSRQGIAPGQVSVILASDSSAYISRLFLEEVRHDLRRSRAGAFEILIDDVAGAVHPRPISRALQPALESVGKTLI